MFRSFRFKAVLRHLIYRYAIRCYLRSKYVGSWVETFLPQYLKSQGYVNHVIGKVRTEYCLEFCVLTYEFYIGD